MDSYLEKYSAVLQPEVIKIPKTNYIIIDNDVLAESNRALQTAISLDLVSNAIHKYMNEHLDFRYALFPLEGVWHLLDGKTGFSKPENIDGGIGKFNNNALAVELNKMNEEGYEIVNASASVTGNLTRVLYLFKRKL